VVELANAETLFGEEVAMMGLRLTAVSLTLVALACDSPTVPSMFPAPTNISPGQTIRHRVSTEEFRLCGGMSRVYCKHYSLRAPYQGLLEVTLTLSPELADSADLGVSVVEPNGFHRFSNQLGSERGVALQVTPDSLYKINLYALTEGVEFDFRTTLHAGG
jgi:hypothetical protein